MCAVSAQNLYNVHNLKNIIQYLEFNILVFCVSSLSHYDICTPTNLNCSGCVVAFQNLKESQKLLNNKKKDR